MRYEILLILVLLCVSPVAVAAPAHHSHDQIGIASWYQMGAGHPTASGELFNPSAMTAAHRSLPLGTRVRITNTKNGESVMARINDRGPYSGNRILDVSRHVAEVLNFRTAGLTQVRIEIGPTD